MSQPAWAGFLGLVLAARIGGRGVKELVVKKLIVNELKKLRLMGSLAIPFIENPLPRFLRV